MPARPRSTRRERSSPRVAAAMADLRIAVTTRRSRDRLRPCTTRHQPQGRELTSSWKHSRPATTEYVPTLEDDPALGLSHREKMEILFAVMLGLFLGALDQTIVGPALPTIVTQLQRQRLLRLGHHHLPADQHDQRPVLGQAVRPLRPQADLHDRHRHLPVGSALSGLSQNMAHADPVPRHPGHRRRLAVPGRARDHRRPVHPAGARQVPGPLRGRVRHRVRRRPAHRRLADREPQLALDLLRQHPDRDRRADRHPAAAADGQDGRRDRATSTSSAARSSRSRWCSCWSA